MLNEIFELCATTLLNGPANMTAQEALVNFSLATGVNIDTSTAQEFEEYLENEALFPCESCGHWFHAPNLELICEECNG